MCLAFTDRLEGEIGRIEALEVLSTLEHQNHQAVETKKPPKQEARKRPASTNLEGDIKKASKLEDDDHTSKEVVTVSNVESFSNSESAANGSLQLEKASAQIAELQTSLADAERERHENQLRAVNAEAALHEIKKKLDAAINNRDQEVLAGSKRLENDIKAKQEKKLLAQKETLERHFQKSKGLMQEGVIANKQKYKSQLEAKEKAHDEKIEEWKGKLRTKNDEIKDLKAEHQQVQRNLKADCQDKVKEARPETAKKFVEKENELKQAKVEIGQLKSKNKKLEESLDKSKQTVKTLEEQKTIFKDAFNRERAEVEHLKEIIVSREGLLDRWKQSHKDLGAATDAKLEHEGRKWRMQYDKAEELARNLVDQQRAVFVLRHGNESKDVEIADKDTKIEKLEGELRASHMQGVVAETGSGSVDSKDLHEHKRDSGLDLVDETFDVTHLGDWSTGAAAVDKFVLQTEGVVQMNKVDEAASLLGDWSAPLPISA